MHVPGSRSRQTTRRPTPLPVLCSLIPMRSQPIGLDVDVSATPLTAMRYVADPGRLSIIDSSGALRARGPERQHMSSRTESRSAQPAPVQPGVSRWSTVALLLGWAACVLLLVYFLEVRPRLQTRAPAVETVATVQAGFPAPPQGAVVYSRQLGRDALALGIVPGSGRVVVQASVVGPQGDGVSGLDVTFATAAQSASGRSCGAGCYRAVLPTQSRPQAIDVAVEGDSSTRWRVLLPEQWPPQNAAPLVGRAGRVWRSLHSLSFDETLGSGLKHVVTSAWTARAPDRLTYRIVGGASAVIIGKRRWDRNPGEAWVSSPQSPIRQPIPPWVGVTDASIVGPTVADGRQALVLTFFDPNIPGWFRVVVDRSTLRTLDLRMVATAHFMHDRLHAFNDTLAIRPPSRD